MDLDLESYGITGKIQGDPQTVAALVLRLEKLRKLEGFKNPGKLSPFKDKHLDWKSANSDTFEKHIVEAIKADDCVRLAEVLPLWSTKVVTEKWSGRHDPKLVLGKVGGLWVKQSGSWASLLTIGEFGRDTLRHIGEVEVQTNSSYHKERFGSLTDMAWAKLTTYSNMDRGYVDETLAHLVPHMALGEKSESSTWARVISASRALKNVTALDLIKSVTAMEEHNKVVFEPNQCTKLAKLSLLRGSRDVLDFFAARSNKLLGDLREGAFEDNFIKNLTSAGFRLAEDLGVDMAEKINGVKVSSKYQNRLEMFKQYISRRNLDPTVQMDADIACDIDLA